MPIYPCHKYNYNFNISLRGGDKLRPGSLLNVTFWFRSGKSKSVVVPFDPEPGIQVKPDVALYTQPVTVICFKNRVRILAQAGISLNQLEYIQLFGEISYQNYVQIGNYTSRGFQLNTKVS